MAGEGKKESLEARKAAILAEKERRAAAKKPATDQPLPAASVAPFDFSIDTPATGQTLRPAVIAPFDTSLDEPAVEPAAVDTPAVEDALPSSEEINVGQLETDLNRLGIPASGLATMTHRELAIFNNSLHERFGGVSGDERTKVDDALRILAKLQHKKGVDENFNLSEEDWAKFHGEMIKAGLKGAFDRDHALRQIKKAISIARKWLAEHPGNAQLSYILDWNTKQLEEKSATRKTTRPPAVPSATKKIQLSESQKRERERNDRKAIKEIEGRIAKPIGDFTKDELVEELKWARGQLDFPRINETEFSDIKRKLELRVIEIKIAQDTTATTSEVPAAVEIPEVETVEDIDTQIAKVKRDVAARVKVLAGLRGRNESEHVDHARLEAKIKEVEQGKEELIALGKSLVARKAALEGNKDKDIVAETNLVLAKDIKELLVETDFFIYMSELRGCEQNINAEIEQTAKGTERYVELQDMSGKIADRILEVEQLRDSKLSNLGRATKREVPPPAREPATGQETTELSELKKELEAQGADVEQLENKNSDQIMDLIALVRRMKWRESGNGTLTPAVNTFLEETREKMGVVWRRKMEEENKLLPIQASLRMHLEINSGINRRSKSESLEGLEEVRKIVKKWEEKYPGNEEVLEELRKLDLAEPYLTESFMQEVNPAALIDSLTAAFPKSGDKAATDAWLVEAEKTLAILMDMQVKDKQRMAELDEAEARLNAGLDGRGQDVDK